MSERPVPREVVSGDTILKRLAPADAVISFWDLTGVQKAQVWFGGGVGILAAVFLLAWGAYWLGYSPKVPALSSDPITAKALLDNYKAASALFLDDLFRVFDVVIAKALLPLFTLILGYLFGANLQSSKTDDAGE